MKTKKVVVTLKYFKGELNPFDGAALECALQLGVKEIICLSMAPMSALNALQSLTRLGVKVALISDPLYAGSDTIATSYILAEGIRRLNPDLIFCGRQSVDGDTAQVPSMLAERLGYDIKTRVTEIGERFTLRNGESIALTDKTIYTFERIRTLRFPSIFSRLGEVEIWDNKTLGLDEELCGLKGSPTRVIKSYESNVGRRSCSFVGKEKLKELIRTSLSKQRAEQVIALDEKLDTVYFVGSLKAVAEGIANEAIELEVGDKNAEEIAKSIQEKKIRTVLWEDSEELKILASKVAVLTGAGLCADCISFRVEKGKLVMTRPALGGNITADIVCDSEIAFATVRTVKAKQSEVVFSVGKGGVEYLEEIKELANEFEAELCASRIVVDSGKMPYLCQVGLTGKTVAPKVYVTFGISGAVQHTCAISGSGTVIAVNEDKQARIFDYADFGIVENIKNLF